MMRYIKWISSLRFFQVFHWVQIHFLSDQRSIQGYIWPSFYICICHLQAPNLKRKKEKLVFLLYTVSNSEVSSTSSFAFSCNYRTNMAQRCVACRTYCIVCLLLFFCCFCFCHTYKNVSFGKKLFLKQQRRERQQHRRQRYS